MVESRTENLADKPSIKKKLMEYYKDIEKGFQDQNQRFDDTKDYWDIYNCQINQNQFYDGNSSIYVPIVHNAVEARKTRFTNQLFPANGRYVEVVSESGDIPYAHMALLEHYVRKCKLRTKIAPALCVQGDVEGQYTVYVSWKKISRHITSKVKRPIKIGGEEMGGVDDFEDIEEEEVVEQFPDVEIIPDADLLILPQTADSVDDAIEKGGSVTVIMRMTKQEVKDKIAAGEFSKDAGDVLVSGFQANMAAQRKNSRSEIAEAAGIQLKGGKKFALVYQTWKKIKVGKETRLCVAYYGGKDVILDCTVNPYWCDRVPVISTPVDKMGGVFKGRSPIAVCGPLQYAANDAINEGMDSAAYSLLPIVMTDPEKNPRVGSMVLSVAAIWETNPNDTKFAEFPQLWKDAFEIVASAKNEIFQTLSVNPAMMPGSVGGKNKKNQAEIANEQQVDILTTADAVTVLEEGIFSEILQRFFDYDLQFREDPITIKTYGEMGVRSKMEEVTPLQQSDRYTFRWLGVETARNAQMMQQQISAVNVIRGIPPQMYPGRTLDLTPAIESMMENVFGPKLAPRIFKDPRSDLAVDPEMENQMLDSGLEAMVHPMDDDIKHLKAHMEGMNTHGDQSGFYRLHIMKHQMQLNAKQQEMMKKMGPPQGQGNPGTPGGGGPGIAGIPKPGSVPAGPSNMKAPPGAIPQDQMQDPSVMPRKM